MNKLSGNKYGSPSKPYYGLSKMDKGYYKICSFRTVKNRYADGETCVLVELINEVIFLPKYLAADLNEEDITSLNTDGVTKYLYFGGKRSENK